jgi:hypothetical protein
MNKNDFVFLIFVFLFVLFLTTLSKNITTFFHESVVNRTCVDSLEKQYFGEKYAAGELFLIQSGNYSKDEVTKAINYYGLSIKKYQINSFVIDVPIGKEIVWMCILREEKFAKIVSLNYFLKVGMKIE